MNKFLIILLTCFSFGNQVKGQFFEPLPPSINSKKIEFAPSISADGNTLLYQSNKDGKYKIYIATKSDGEWQSKPVNSINNYRSGKSLVSGPNLSYDGNFIYFFASFPGSIGKEDIWYVEKTRTGWSDPVNAGIAINTAGYEGFPSISADGNKLYFMRSVSQNPFDGKYCYKLFVSEKSTMGVWQSATPLPSPVNSGCENCPRILPDNTTLLFASIRGDQDSPNYDLYMSKQDLSGQWSEPVPLDFLNTSADELYGTISAAGQQMITNRKENDNYDLVSLRIAPEFRPKTTLAVSGSVMDEQTGKHLKASIQVKSQDFPTSVISSNEADGNYTMVLAAGSTYEITTSASGYEDEVKYIDMRSKQDYELITENIKLKRKTNASIIHLTHAQTKEYLQAVISINNEPVEKWVNNGYEVKLTHGEPYTISILKEGYESIIDIKNFTPEQFEETLYLNYDLIPLKPELNLEITEKGEKIPLANSLFLLYDANAKKVIYQGSLIDGTYEHTLEFGKLYFYKALAQNFFYTEGQIDMREVGIGGPFPFKVELVPLKVGERLTLNSIQFETGSAELSGASKQILNNVINVLAQNRNIVVEIAAYTDNVGHAHYNKVLSEKRAESVMNYFLSQQVPQFMISAKGYGEHHPIASNHTEDGRSKNRRVEFIVKEVK